MNTKKLVKSGDNKPLRDEKGRLLPGSTCNPNGRPPGTLSLVGMLKAKLEEVDPQTKKQYAQLLIDRIVKMAILESSDSQIRNILNYVDGLPRQSIEMNANIQPSLVKFIGDDTVEDNTNSETLQRDSTSY